jgi:pimeloyl-ACP methyl ester carboxylesterase
MVACTLVRVVGLGHGGYMANYGYGAGRDLQYLSRLDRAIEEFATLYDADTEPNRKTIILFPGGLGSQLMRARTPYTQPPFNYYKTWLACNIVFGEARNLHLLPGAVDESQQYVVPDGAVDFFNVQPYSGFIEWCRQNLIHLFVFGWDWRRGVQDCSDFFLETFMPKFEAVFANTNPHPLDDFTLVGHSAGGMAVKVIANQARNRYVQRMKRAITVATPFYGYGPQTHCFLKGDKDLNRTLSGSHPAKSMIRIISSMPGMYEFLYLDHDTYQSNKAAFANDPEGYNLSVYPSLDKRDHTEVADPYNPLPDNKGRVRYPTTCGFDTDLLHCGMAASRKVSSGLARSVAAKFYNIRGVQAKNGKKQRKTVISHLWGRVSPQFDPDTDSDPIEDAMGYGDGVQPAWTARLLGLADPAKHVITIVDDIEHMTMMNAPSVQRKIAALLELDQQVLTFIKSRKAPMASRAALEKFLDGMRARTAKKRTPAEHRELVRRYLRKFKRDDLHKLMARAYMDALKSPSQKG